MRLIPVDAKRQDWPRLVAQRVNELSRALDAQNNLTRAKQRALRG